jgi:hypothetical protein
VRQGAFGIERGLPTFVGHIGVAIFGADTRTMAITKGRPVFG